MGLGGVLNKRGPGCAIRNRRPVNVCRKCVVAVVAVGGPNSEQTDSQKPRKAPGGMYPNVDGNAGPGRIELRELQRNRRIS